MVVSSVLGNIGHLKRTRGETSIWSDNCQLYNNTTKEITKAFCAAVDSIHLPTGSTAHDGFIASLREERHTKSLQAEDWDWWRRAMPRHGELEFGLWTERVGVVYSTVCTVVGLVNQIRSHPDG